MTKPKIIVGLDIGSTMVRTVIAQLISEPQGVRIIGVGQAPAGGMRRGVVVDVDDAARAISESVEAAEQMAGVMVDRALVSISGSGVTAQDSKGVVAVGKADGEVTEDDINRVINAAQAISVPRNKEIIHIIPKTYRLDDQENIKDPLGMNGVRLEVDAMVIEAPVNHMRNLTKALAQAEVNIEDLILESLATATAVLNKKQKELGVVTVNIGGSTTSLSVFEEGDLIHTATIPVGAGHITNDIAIGLRTSVDIAEKVKLRYGTALPIAIDPHAEVDLSTIDDTEDGVVLHKHIIEIISARLEELFGLVYKELSTIGKAGLLPSGVVVTGGGAAMPHVVECAKKYLKLPATIGSSATELSGILDKVDDPSFTTVLGLIFWGVEHRGVQTDQLLSGRIFRKLPGTISETVAKTRQWFERFLP